ncbi:RNA polymerase sigma-70 factor [Alistipes sp. OttesenSCG-928-B03]|nr:RNA polymerase sigma-70 factor [Alistipes sp. OttesenSCG-928-B03]
MSSKKNPQNTRNVFSDSGALVALIKQRDNAGYVRLYDMYFGRLHRFAYSFVCDYDTANDMVQSVFISLYENAPKLSPDTTLHSWLMAAVRNRCLNYLRGHNIKVYNQLFYLENYEEPELIEHLEDNAELMNRIRRIISALPDKCREICELRFYYNMKQGEIADQLSISTNTVKVQIHRAIQKIREELADMPLAISFILLLLH